LSHSSLLSAATPTPSTSPLPLHDALPISQGAGAGTPRYHAQHRDGRRPAYEVRLDVISPPITTDYRRALSCPADVDQPHPTRRRLPMAAVSAAGVEAKARLSGSLYSHSAQRRHSISTSSAG